MADQTNGPVETGAAMDYSEHDKTYSMFLAGTKYTTDPPRDAADRHGGLLLHRRGRHFQCPDVHRSQHRRRHPGPLKPLPHFEPDPE